MSTYGQLCCALHVQMHCEIRLIDGIDVLPKRCEETRNGGWTTRDPKPLLSVMRALADQRVLVAELLTVKRAATQHAILERMRNHVCVASVAVKLQSAGSSPRRRASISK